MKDEHDNSTGELLPFPAPEADALSRRGRVSAGAQGAGNHKRLPQQSLTAPPPGARSADGIMPLGWGRAVVPVSSVARDWGISARRVRVMLQEGRLEGRQQENGYWEVYFPYRYVLGTRGPQLTRNRNLPERSPYSRKKRVRNAEW